MSNYLSSKKMSSRIRVILTAVPRYFGKQTEAC